MDLNGLLGTPAIIGILQLLAGRYLKGVKEFANRYINVVIFVLGLVGFSIAPTTAHAASVLMPSVAPVLGILSCALGQNFLVTGVHSTFKNTLLPAVKEALTWLALRFLQGGTPK